MTRGKHSLCVDTRTWSLIRDLARAEGATMGDVATRLVMAGYETEKALCPLTGKSCGCEPNSSRRVACSKRPVDLIGIATAPAKEPP